MSERTIAIFTRHPRPKYSKALVDRLLLNDQRIKGMVQCLKDTIKIKDPVGEEIKSFERPNGLKINKVRTPIGVIGIIYESRPNVTSDCIGLCLKSGNAVILKGGKEAFYSNRAIFQSCPRGLKGHEYSPGCDSAGGFHRSCRSQYFTETGSVRRSDSAAWGGRLDTLRC